MLRVSNLSFTYQQNQPLVLQGLSFNLEKGNILNVLGQNAVGKTTLIRCLVRELSSYSGEISLEGKDIKTFSVKEYAKKVGVVSAMFQVYQNLLVADYLTTGFINQLASFSRPSNELIEKAYAVLERFNKPELFIKQINQLSSGEKQIIMISRVLIQDPEVIIFDEPTANLDVKNQIFVLEQMYQLSKLGYTVISSTHNPGHALTLRGETLLMGKGKYLYGMTEEIINGDNLTEYYELDTKVIDNIDFQSIVFSGNAIKLVF